VTFSLQRDEIVPSFIKSATCIYSDPGYISVFKHTLHFYTITHEYIFFSMYTSIFLVSFNMKISL